MEKSESRIEVRGFAVGDLRATSDGRPTIEGYAAVYNQRSELMWNFVEVIEPGFFEGVLFGDIRSVWNHNTDYPLGRTLNGTLLIEDDERGLHVKIDPPDTSWGRDALTSVGRGDVSQMSFAFSVRVDGDRWEKLNDGTYIRYLKRGGCEELYEVSPVTFPAYPQTSVAVRSMVEMLRAGNPNGGEAPEAEEAQRGLEEEKQKVRQRHALRKKRLI